MAMGTPTTTVAAIVVLAISVTAGLFGAAPSAAEAVLHKVAGVEGMPLTFGPSLGLSLGTGGVLKWVLIPDGPCAPKPTEVCVSAGNCFYDLVNKDDAVAGDEEDGQEDGVGDARHRQGGSVCAGKTLAIRTIALMVKDASGNMSPVPQLSGNHGGAHHVPHSGRGRGGAARNVEVTPRGDLRFPSPCKADGGLYGVRVVGPGQSYTFYNVTVFREDDPDGQRHHGGHDDLQHRIEPGEDHDHVSVSMPRQHVVDPHRTSVIHPRLTISPASWRADYNFTYEWHAFVIGDSCAEARIFEACVYHSNSQVCRHPAGQRGCVIGAMTRSSLVGLAALSSCRGADMRTCKFSKTHSGGPLVALGHVFPELRVEASAPTPSLYVFVVKLDDYVAGWAYTELAERGRAISVVVDTHMPEKDRDAPEDGSENGGDGEWDADTWGKYGDANMGAKWSRQATIVTIGSVAGVILFLTCAVVIWVLLLRKRHRLSYDASEYRRSVSGDGGGSGKRKSSSRYGRKTGADQAKHQQHGYTSVPLDEGLVTDEDDEEVLLLRDPKLRHDSSSSSPRRGGRKKGSSKSGGGGNALSRLDKTVRIAVTSVANRLLANKTLQAQRY